MHSFPVSVSCYFRLRFFVFPCCRCVVVSDCLWPHGLQHARLPCPSPSPRVCSSSCPLSWLWYLTISSSAAPFSFCLQPFPASGSFPVSRLFTSGDQSIGASASVLPMNIQGWLPLGLTGLIMQSKGLSRVFCNTKGQKHQFLFPGKLQNVEISVASLESPSYSRKMHN